MQLFVFIINCLKKLFVESACVNFTFMVYYMIILFKSFYLFFTHMVNLTQKIKHGDLQKEWNFFFQKYYLSLILIRNNFPF